MRQRKEAKAPTPLVAVNGAVQLRSAVRAALPAIPEIAEIVFGALCRDAASVVDHPDTGKAAKIVSIEDHIDPLRVAVERVPTQLGERADGMARARFDEGENERADGRERVWQ